MPRSNFGDPPSNRQPRMRIVRPPRMPPLFIRVGLSNIRKEGEFAQAERNRMLGVFSSLLSEHRILWERRQTTPSLMWQMSWPAIVERWEALIPQLNAVGLTEKAGQSKLWLDRAHRNAGQRT
jgi:hypothetical protein